MDGSKKEKGEMNKGYIIVRIKRTRQEGWSEYRTAVTKLISEYGGRYIVQGGMVELLEGQYDGRQLVILEFPSIDIVRSFWHSAAYADVKALRDSSGELDAWAISGV